MTVFLITEVTRCSTRLHMCKIIAQVLKRLFENRKPADQNGFTEQLIPILGCVEQILQIVSLFIDSIQTKFAHFLNQSGSIQL